MNLPHPPARSCVIGEVPSLPGRAAPPLPSEGANGSGMERRRDGRSGVRLTFPKGVAWAILAGTLLGAVVLLAAEFSPLCTVHAATHHALPACGHAGTHHHYALIPIALLIVLLGFAALGGGGRYALGAMAVVAVVALLIGLLHDLPAAQQGRTALRLAGKYVTASSSPSTGMYLETLGAVIVLITAGFGLLLGEPGARDAAARPAD